MKDIGFSQQVAKEDYLPESLFYMLGMKANNETALKFQKWLAFEVIPSIRKTGSYEVLEVTEHEELTKKRLFENCRLYFKNIK